MARTHMVALFDKGSTAKNTIVLGTDLVLPLEADLDGDPTQDDEIRLVSEGGGFDVTLRAGSDDVEIHPEKPLLLYHFHDVPRGTYALSVRIGDGWSTLIPRLEVKKDGVFAGDQKITGSLDDVTVGEAVDGAPLDDDDEQPDFPFYDQPEWASAGG
jgi:hypothetical protein